MENTLRQAEHETKIENDFYMVIEWCVYGLFLLFCNSPSESRKKLSRLANSACIEKNWQIIFLFCCGANKRDDRRRINKAEVISKSLISVNFFSMCGGINAHKSRCVKWKRAKSRVFYGQWSSVSRRVCCGTLMVTDVMWGIFEKF